MGWRKQPEPPFVLSDGDWAKVHAARLAFSDAFDAGEIDGLTAKSIGRVFWQPIRKYLQSIWKRYSGGDGGFLKRKERDPKSKFLIVPYSS